MKAYGKDLPTGAVDIWCRIFFDVPEEVFGDAVRHLVENRDKSSVVVPGEMAAAIRAVGGSVKGFSTTPRFDASPSVRAIRSHDEAGDSEPELSMVDWLKSEAHPGFKEEMKRYAERETPADRIQALVGHPRSTDVTEMRPAMRSKKKVKEERHG